MLGDHDPEKGAQVAEISEKDLKDVLEVRLGLEELAVRIACQRITEEEREAGNRRLKNKVPGSDETMILQHLWWQMSRCMK